MGVTQSAGVHTVQARCPPCVMGDGVALTTPVSKQVRTAQHRSDSPHFSPGKGPLHVLCHCQSEPS